MGDPGRRSSIVQLAHNPRSLLKRQSVVFVAVLGPLGERAGVAPESVPKASNVHEENVVSLGREKQPARSHFPHSFQCSG
jgi:hypothetical protein